MNVKVILIHGNGGATVNGNWFPWVKTELEKMGLTVIAQDFPDAQLARTDQWLPFIEQLGADENTIIIGHSSGAVAAMRFAETNKLLGSILVCAYHTDLGSESEKQSGYFDHPWDWDAIKSSQQWIIQFASTDDPYIPIAEAQFVRDQLHTDYHEFTDKAHFGSPTDMTEFPELIEAVKKHLQPTPIPALTDPPGTQLDSSLPASPLLPPPPKTKPVPKKKSRTKPHKKKSSVHKANK